MTMHALKPTGPGSPDGGGFAWLVEVVHEIAHAHAGPDTACHYVPGDCADPELKKLCPAMNRETAARLSKSLSEAGVEVAEQVEPVRFLFPAMSPHQHVLVLPLAWEGRTAGILVVAAATPPLGKAGLTRVTRMAGHGLGWVSTAGAITDGLAAATTEKARLDADLRWARMFLDLREVLIAARTTTELVSALADWLGAPVALQLPDVMEPVVAGAGARELAMSTTHDEIRPEAVARASSADRSRTIPATGLLPDRVVTPIFTTSGDFAGFLVAAVGERGLDVTRRALAASHGLLDYQMSVKQEIAASLAALRRALLTDLLKKPFSDDLVTRAASLGHDLSATHIPLAVGSADGAPLDRMLDRTLKIIEHAGARASSAAAVTMLGVVDDLVLAFVPEPVPAGAAELGQLIQDAATAADLPLVVGIGPACARATDMAATAACARRAVQVLRTIASERRTQVAQFDDLGVYGLLFDEQRPGDLSAYATRWLEPLLDYDQRNTTALVETLRQVFRQDRLSGAAATLHIHTATLAYRRGRIEEILGMSLDSWDNVFNLELALRVMSCADHLQATPRPG